jgi:predicted membrane protein
MEINKEENKEPIEEKNQWEEYRSNGKIFGGLILIGIGCLFLAREMGAFIPTWLFSWPVLLITIGLYIGVKHQFQKSSWMILVFIGSVFLVRDFFPEYHLSNYLWPIGLIFFGLYMIAKPKNKDCRNKNRWGNYGRHKYSEKGNYKGWEMQDSTSQHGSDYLDVSSVFGNVKKTVISKEFKGGEVNCVFGGSEINLTQADIVGRVELEVNVVFGGARIIVPAHWEIKSELTAVLGGAEDKRQNINIINKDPNKFLVLRGTALFGGIEILSY